MTDLDGRTAFVTGAGGGIGEACARAFAACGAKVSVVDINADRAHAVADSINGTAIVMDLSDTKALESLQLSTDILVNNAGVQTVNSIEDFSPERFRFMLQLMVEAPFLLVRAALPQMYARQFGRIINISSVHGLRASPHKVAYVTAKHAVEGLSKVTAAEGGQRNVTSNCVNPGYVRTPLVTGQIAGQAKAHNISENEVVEKVLLKRAAIKQLIEPSDVADLVTWLASDSAKMATGASYVMDGGWSAQ